MSALRPSLARTAAAGLALLLFALPFGGAAQEAEPPAPAPATEEVHSDISTREIAIQSNFTGIELVVFGAVDNADREPDAPPYDVIVVVRGPSHDLVARQKERVGGIWLNGTSKIFPDVPGFYAVLSTRPLRAIADEEMLQRLKVGYGTLDLGPDDVTSVQDDLFRDAVIRIQQDKRLFQYLDNGVSFVGRSLFRGTVDMPVNVPIGLYTTEVFLFQDGQLLSKDDTSLHVQKVGFERGVYTLAFQHPLVYGLIAVILALLMGLGAWAVFGRD